MGSALALLARRAKIGITLNEAAEMIVSIKPILILAAAVRILFMILLF